MGASEDRCRRQTPGEILELRCNGLNFEEPEQLVQLWKLRPQKLKNHLRAIRANHLAEEADNSMV